MKILISTVILLLQHAVCVTAAAATFTLRGSSNMILFDQDETSICPKSSQDAMDLMLVKNHQHPQDSSSSSSSSSIGKVWITKHPHHNKTCVNMDLQQDVSSTTHKSLRIQCVDIYYQCAPPPPSTADSEYTYHLDDDLFLLTSSSSWCFDTLACEEDDVDTIMRNDEDDDKDDNDGVLFKSMASTTTTEGYMAFRAKVMEVEASSMFLREEENLLLFHQQNHKIAEIVDSLPFLFGEEHHQQHRHLQTEEHCEPFGLADQQALETELERFADEALLSVKYRMMPGALRDAFFTVGNLFDLSSLRGWCVDSDHPMCISCTYPFDVCSSYRDDLSRIEGEGALNNVTNLPAANWLINNYPVNTPLSDTDPLCPVPNGQVVTWQMFQAVLWKLIDQGYHRIINCQNNECEDAADYLTACALQYGANYKPVCCNETIGMILVWDNDYTGALSKQELFVEVPLADIPGVCVDEPPITEMPLAPGDDPCYDTFIDVDAIETALIPWADEATMSIKYRGVPGTRLDAYFTVGGLLGLEDLVAWCIDVDQDACIDCELDMDSFSTYDEEGLQELIANSLAENLPVNLTNFNETNFLINEFRTGTLLEDSEWCDFENLDPGTEVTWQMMQRAMWVLTDHDYDSILNCRDDRACGIAADQLVACALAEGGDYIPNCCPHNKVGVMIVYDDPETSFKDRQELLVEIPLRHIPGACPEEFYDEFDDSRFLKEEDSSVSFISDATAHQDSSSYALPPCRMV